MTLNLCVGLLHLHFPLQPLKIELKCGLGGINSSWSHSFWSHPFWSHCIRSRHTHSGHAASDLTRSGRTHSSDTALGLTVLVALILVALSGRTVSSRTVAMAFVLRQMPYAIRLQSTDFRHFYVCNMANALWHLFYGRCPTLFDFGRPTFDASTQAIWQMP